MILRDALFLERNHVITQLTLHIGDPKTGTSSIQHALGQGFVDAAPLRLALWKQPNAVGLSKILRTGDADKQAERYGEVRTWLDSCTADHAVISSETFSHTDPGVLQQVLHDHVPAHADTARVIAYVRPHVSRFLAAFIQRTKIGSLYEDTETFLKNIVRTQALRYADRFGPWRAIYGERYTLRPFIRSELRGQDAVTDFVTEILGDVSFRLTEPIEQNVAVPLHSLAGMQLMQHRFREVGVNDKGRRTMGAAMANSFLLAKPLAGEKPILDRATTEILIRTFEKDARKLDEMFFSGPLMQDGLARSTDKVAERPIDLTPSLYFSPARERQVIALSEEIGKSVATKQRLWGLHHRSRKRTVETSPKEAVRLKENRTVLEQIDRNMVELADVLRG